uniref:Argonaute linker 1 domain-containing protein n=1 Tax=Oryza barthii TaxID=65489 RepID=A0A0D3FMH5_9ORYZ
MSSRGGGVGGRRGGPGGASSVRGGERGRKRGRGALDAVEPRVPLPRGTGSGPGAGRDGAAAPVPALQPAEADVLSGEVETEMAAGMEAREGASSSSSASAPAVGEVEPPSRAVGALPPTSSKAVVLQARPGFGTVGTSCRVRANHFVVQLADKEIYHYDAAGAVAPAAPAVSVAASADANAVEPRVPLPRGTGSGPGAGRDGAAAPVPALQPAEADVLSGEVETEMAAGMEAREGASSSSSASAPAVGEVEPPSRAVGALPPTSSKAVVLQARPGFGTVGTSCRVRANHFVVQLADKEIYHYDVAIAPELRSRERNRNIINELFRSHKKYLDGRRSPAYDARKGMFTAGALPFTDREFVVKIANDPERGNQGEKEFKVTIKCAGAANLYMHSLKQFLAGRQRELPQDTIQALDIALRECPSSRYTSISRSFFSQAFGHKDIGCGVEWWRGYYQSLRPSQMGLSLNIGIVPNSLP